MLAVLSCIHANAAALRAVLADIASQRAGAIYCLGDVLGYGPDPVECLDLAMDFDVVLLGNHDRAVLTEPDWFGKCAERAVLFHKRVLARAGPRCRALLFIADLPLSHAEGHTLYVHGSPRHPTHEYVFPEDIYNSPKMARIAALLDDVCFNGHTHIPGVFTEAATDVWLYRGPDECGGEYRLDGRKTIINVGSVGQPRDNDPRAGYVLFDGETVRFRRVEYDVEETVRRVRARPDLDDFLGDRLREGR
jgi:predicted phosphodiesterase